MSIPAGWTQVLNFFDTALVFEPSRGQLSSDTGLLPNCQFDQRRSEALGRQRRGEGAE
jgi:hypothetical protein